jgi:hypothetical protein
MNRSRSMNEAHVQEWVAALRSDAYPQTRDQLKGLVVDGGDVTDVVGYCCLGVGCEVAHIITQEHGGYGAEGADMLPPIEFMEWLGITEFHSENNLSGDGVAFNLYLDAPKDLEMRTPVRSCYKLHMVPLSDLNDVVRLTFPQIGDLIAYFGVWA